MPAEFWLPQNCRKRRDITCRFQNFHVDVFQASTWTKKVLDNGKKWGHALEHDLMFSGRDQEEPMRISTRRPKLFRVPPASVIVFAALLFLPAAAHAQAAGSPFDTGFTALQNLFTGTIAKVASLIAIVIGGYGFAHGEPGAKKALAGVAAGTGIAVLAVNVLSWLWGV
jgi:type IV secretory pathway VirB2 component (pilin)